MVEPLSSLREGEIAEVVWIISEADIRDMLGETAFCLVKPSPVCLKTRHDSYVYTKYADGWLLCGKNIQKRYWYRADIIIACQYLFCNYNAL